MEKAQPYATKPDPSSPAGVKGAIVANQSSWLTNSTERLATWTSTSTSSSPARVRVQPITTSKPRTYTWS